MVRALFSLSLWYVNEGDKMQNKYTENHLNGNAVNGKQMMEHKDDTKMELSMANTKKTNHKIYGRKIVIHRK